MSAMEYSGPERRRRPGEEPTRILIVDNHVLFRVGIAQILSKEADLEVVGDDVRCCVGLGQGGR